METTYVHVDEGIVILVITLDIIYILLVCTMKHTLVYTLKDDTGT